MEFLIAVLALFFFLFSSGSEISDLQLASLAAAVFLRRPVSSPASVLGSNSSLYAMRS